MAVSNQLTSAQVPLPMSAGGPTPNCIRSGLDLLIGSPNSHLSATPGTGFYTNPTTGARSSIVVDTEDPHKDFTSFDTGTYHVWLTTNKLLSVTTALTIPFNGILYLGSVTVSGGMITQICNSGVCYMAGGLCYRLVTDTAFSSTPTTNPAVGLLQDASPGLASYSRFVTITPFGTLLWDGKYYNRMFTPTSPEIDIKLLGAAGDGTTDDTWPLQAGIDLAGIDFKLDGSNLLVPGERGGRVHIPGLPSDKFYLITDALFLRNQVEVFGDGAASRIRNAQTVPSNRTKACFYAGSYAENDAEVFGNCKAIGGFAVGDQKVTLTVHGDASNFAVGDLVMVRSNVGITSGDWSYIEMNEVTSSSTSSGEIGLKYPFPEAVSAGQLVIMPKLPVSYGITGTPPSYLAKRVILRDITVESINGPWMSRIGCFESQFENIHILDSESGIYGNAIAHSTWRSIDGVFIGRALEIATGASNSSFEDIRMAYKSRGNNINTYQDVLVVLTGSRMKLRGVTVDASVANYFQGDSGATPPIPAGYTIGAALRVGGTGNIVEDLVVNAQKITTATVLMSTGTNMFTRRNVVRNSIFRMGNDSGSVNTHIRVSTPDLNGTAEDLTFENCQFFGSASSASITINGGNRVFVTNCRFELGSTGGSRHIDISQTSPVMTDPDNPTISDLSIRGCWFDGPISVEALRALTGSRVDVRDCTFQCGTSVLTQYLNIATASRLPVPNQFSVSGCLFNGQVGQSGLAAAAGNAVSVTDCQFQLGTGTPSSVVTPASTGGTDLGVQGLLVQRCRFLGGASNAVSVQNGTTIEVLDNYFENGGYANSLPTGSTYIFSGNRSKSGNQLALLKKSDFSLFNTELKNTGTDPVQWWSMTIPKGLLRAGDRIRIQIFGAMSAASGTSNNRYLGWKFINSDASVIAAQYNITNSPTTDLATTLEIAVRSNAQALTAYMSSFIGLNFLRESGKSFNLDFSTHDLTLSLQGKTAGADFFSFDAIIVDIMRPYEIIG
jgi:hypothetical protein